MCWCCSGPPITPAALRPATATVGYMVYVEQRKRLRVARAVQRAMHGGHCPAHIHKLDAAKQLQQSEIVD
jgi:hypothetical protein